MHLIGFIIRTHKKRCQNSQSSVYAHAEGPRIMSQARDSQPRVFLWFPLASSGECLVNRSTTNEAMTAYSFPLITDK